MNDFLDPLQCRNLIAELAEMLPRILSRQELAAWPSPFDEPDDMRRRWDPVFTGGAVVGLLITDPAAPPPSRTKDIDIVLEIAGYGEFAAMEQSLRQAGFTQNWLDNMPVVAWHWRGIRVDFLPHLPNEMMTSSNRWFPYLVEEAQRIEVSPKKFAWLASAPCFIATKLEAFFSRGKGDYLTSKDMEDILAIVDGREELMVEMNFTAPDVRGFIAASFRELMGGGRFMESVPQIVPDETREAIVVRNLLKLAASK